MLLFKTKNIPHHKCHDQQSSKGKGRAFLSTRAHSYQVGDLGRLPLLRCLRLLELGEPLRHLLPRVTRDLAQRRCAGFVVVRVPERHALAQLPRSSCPPDAVDVALHVACHVEVDDVPVLAGEVLEL